MKGKRFDPAFKKDIAHLYVSGNRSCASLADELGGLIITTVETP